MQNNALTLNLDRDTLAFLRRKALLSERLDDLWAFYEPEIAACAERLLRECRNGSWVRALELLRGLGWQGCEIFAAADIGTRHLLHSVEAASEIESAWTHIPRGRWTRLVTQWRGRLGVAGALQIVAQELGLRGSGLQERMSRDVRAPFLVGVSSASTA